MGRQAEKDADLDRVHWVKETQDAGTVRWASRVITPRLGTQDTAQL